MNSPESESAGTKSIAKTLISKNVTPCNCPTQPKLDSNNSCPICLLKFNADQRLPRGFNSTHNIICQKCIFQLHPKVNSLINFPLLIFLGFSIEEIPSRNESDSGEKDSSACFQTIENLNQLAFVARSGYASRATLKKILSLLQWLTPSTHLKLIKHCKSLGNRILLELIAQNQGSNYRAQQQLWAAIRSKACQFMGPALQDEAIKLILLALEDGSALSKKILIMFVVQRLNPQFPQASKTSIGHVIQLLYRSSCFHFIKQGGSGSGSGTCTGTGSESVSGSDARIEDSAKEGGSGALSNLMTLKQEFRSYEAIRCEHDTQIIKIALESGLHFAPDQWSQILYGDVTHKSQMQSILDKLVEPQSFKQLTAEYLITIQRLQDEEQSKLLLSIHPCFEKLAAIDINTAECTWVNVENLTSLVNQTLQVLIQQKKSLPEKANKRRPSRTTSLLVSPTY